ncbi:MAG: FAD-binding protein, partial [Rhodospirillales bacterium]|nr:FAD-binding protein [Rhodospirillales bacterium]
MVEPTLVPKLSESRVDREARSYDFGRITRKVPQTVARPKSVEEVSSIVRWAGGKALPLAIRGGGHSQGGQSLTDSGVSLDTVWLGQVEREGQDLLVAQGGARWGAVVDTLRGTGRLPRVLTDIGEVTVGGTLAAGGFGTTSYRYGLQIAQVEQLEVVIGTGERVRCSPSQNSDLFDAVRGGQGQFGIITAAWIRLRATGTRIRRYELLYRDYDRFAIDFERVVDEGAVDRLRAETRVHDREIILDIGVEYDE